MQTRCIAAEGQLQHLQEALDAVLEELESTRAAINKASGKSVAPSMHRYACVCMPASICVTVYSQPLTQVGVIG